MSSGQPELGRNFSLKLQYNCPILYFTLACVMNSQQHNTCSLFAHKCCNTSWRLWWMYCMYGMNNCIRFIRVNYGKFPKVKIFNSNVSLWLALSVWQHQLKLLTTRVCGAWLSTWWKSWLRTCIPKILKEHMIMILFVRRLKFTER